MDSSSGPQPKRKRHDEPSTFTNINARNSKRVKVFTARSVLSQTPDKALNQNGELDVSAFVKAREYEINSLEASMRSSKNALTSRAFQKVPRELRRRTASHNVKRVPKRLRARAVKEVRISIFSRTDELRISRRLTISRKEADEG